MTSSQSATAFFANAVFETAKASQYLQQLCKHFAHKVPASWDETNGQVTFSIGTSKFEAKQTQLQISCLATTPDELTQVCGVVEDHLARFAFRESPIQLTWVSQ